MGVGRDTHVLSRLDVACTPKVWPAGGSIQTFSSAAIAISVVKVLARCVHLSSFHNKALHRIL